MGQLFNRQVQVVVGSLQVTNLRCIFKAKKTSTPQPNTLELSIYNLAAATRAQMQAKGSPVVVEAGYVGSPLGTVFSGVSRTIDHVREGPDWVSKVQCGDGEQSFQFATVSKSYAPGTSITQVLQDLAKSLGINPGNLAQQLATAGPAAVLKQFTKGFLAQGRAAPHFDDLVKSIGLEWSIQDGALQLLAPTAVNPGLAEVLSVSTGLLDSPEHGTPQAVGKPSYLKIKCLLRANIRPGSPIQLQSVATNNLPVNYRAVNVEHEGDTSGGPWETRIEALMLGGGASSSASSGASAGGGA